MTTSITYQSSDTNIESLFVSCLPDFSSSSTDGGILNTNKLTAALKRLNALEVKEGGLEIIESVITKENSNAKWQGKGDSLSSGDQDPAQSLKFDYKIFTDNVIINTFDKARVKGKYMIQDWLALHRKQAVATIKNSFNSAFWKASPGDNEPNSIPQIINTTNTTGTLAGVSRVGNKYMQNGVYSTAIADIGSEAGVSKLIELKIRYSKGGNINLMILDTTRYAGLAGYLASQKRYNPDDKMAKLDFEAIWLGDTLITYEGLSDDLLVTGDTITSGYLYGISTEHLKIKTLSDGDSKWGTEFERIPLTLKKSLPFYWFGNISTDLPCAHFVASSVAST